jgi:hypothetical protein
MNAEVSEAMRQAGDPLVPVTFGGWLTRVRGCSAAVIAHCGAFT